MRTEADKQRKIHIHEDFTGRWEYTAYKGKYRNSQIIGTLTSYRRQSEQGLKVWIGGNVFIHTETATV